MSKELVDNTPLRIKYKKLESQEDLTLAEVASRCGWLARDSKSGSMKPDSSRVARSLGLAKENGQMRKSLSRDNTELLCMALHVEFTEVGI